MTRHYFLDSNTPEGFFSYYEYLMKQEEAERIYIIKGGPGTGKSTTIKRAGKWAEDAGFHVDYIHCSCDPDSMDGIIIQELRVALVDGTSPHMVEPKTPGAVDSIINMGRFWDEEGLRKEKEGIMHSNKIIAQNFARAYGYLAAAGQLYRDMDNIMMSCRNRGAFQSIVDEIISDIPQSPGKMGEERKCFLSAITPNGKIDYTTNLASYAEVVLICSDFETENGALITEAAQHMLERGLDIECYYHPMMPTERIEHIYVPTLGRAYITQSAKSMSTIEAKKIISAEQVVRKDILRRFAIDLSYNHMCMDNLVGKAVDTISKAKKEHDTMEQYYITNMNFAQIEEANGRLIEQLKSMPRVS